MLTERYGRESKAFKSWKGMMGPRGKVDEATRHIAAAAAWGLNPEEDATYLMYGGEHDPGKGYTATYRVPENGAFWSITVYGDDGYMKSENAILNSSNAKLNAGRDLHGLLRIEGALRRRPEPPRRHARLELPAARLPAGAERPRRELRAAGGEAGEVGAAVHATGRPAAPGAGSPASRTSTSISPSRSRTFASARMGHQS